MASVDQIRVGLAAFFDQVVRPTLPGMKGVLYGTAVGIALAKPERLLEKVMPTAKMIGIMDESGQIDIVTLARELKKQMAAAGGEMRVELKLNPLNPAEVEVFRFTPGDIDMLAEMIARA